MIKIQDPVFKAFSLRLISSCCSVGIANSKIYIDCSLSNRPQTDILQPPKGGPEETSRAFRNCLKYHDGEGAESDLQGGMTGRQIWGPGAKTALTRGATCMEWASCVWKERSEGSVLRLYRLVGLLSFRHY